MRRSPIFRNSDDRLRGLEREAVAAGDLASLMRLLFEARRTSAPVKQNWMDLIVATAPGVDEWREVLSVVPGSQHETLLSSLRDARAWTFLITAFSGMPGGLPAWTEAPITATLNALQGRNRVSVGRALRRAVDELRERRATARGPLVEFAVQAERERDREIRQGGFYQLEDGVEVAPGQTVEFGALRHVSAQPGALRGDHYWMPWFLSSGHHMRGDSITRANRETFLTAWSGEWARVHRVTGNHGFEAALIRLDVECPPEMLEALETARDGEDLDEDARYDLEERERHEAWDDWIKYDMTRALGAAFPSVRRQITDLDERDLYDLFYEATERRERSETPWGYGPQGAEINIDELVKSELTIEDVESAIEKARTREAGEGEQEQGD